VNPPNVILILADDLGWTDLSCYGTRFYETPNLDRLACEGMRFTDAYAACPVCSPTRASILTGRYPARVGITDWIDSFGTLHPAKGVLVDAPYLKNLPTTETTLAQRLHAEGYRTWHVGKWHLGGQGHLPQNFGFDVNIGGCHRGSPGPGGYFSPWTTIEALKDVDVPPGTYLTDYLADQAVDLIQRSTGPFFLNMWSYLVHTPIQAPEPLVEKYRSKARRLGLDEAEAFDEGGFFPAEHKKTRRIRRRLLHSDPVYAAMVEKLDESVGRILAAVDEKGETGNTFVIFTSDNGGLATSEGSPTTNRPLAEGKGWMYDGGTREPLIVKWPDHVRPSTTSGAVVTSTDFVPTILEAVGLPPLAEGEIDGVSFVPALRGGPFERGPIYWHYPHYGNQGGTPGASVRDGDWKLIRFFEDGHEELYNLREDIGEEHDLVTREPARARALSDALSRWQSGVEALIPERNAAFAPWAGREPSGHSRRQPGPAAGVFRES
jgi:arylsulfatase A-like enzyme